jgi:xylulokinase
LTGRGFFIGLDLGTSGLKGVVVDSTGELVASAQASYATHRPSPGRAEQSPGDWVVAANAVIRQLGSTSPTKDWLVIGFAGMIPTLVTLDDARKPVGPAITWEDARSEAEGRSLREAVGPDHLYRMTGQWVDGRYLLPMLAWLRHHEPSRARSTASICSAKDYLYLYMTGEVATDPSTAAGYGCYALESARWDTGIAQAAGVVPSELPEVVPSTATAPIRPEVAHELSLPKGLPVCVGAADSVLGALGLGVTEPGQIAYVAGTSTVILGVADRVQVDAAHRYLVTPLATTDRWGLEMDLLSTGSALQWLAGVLGIEDGVRALLELAAASTPGAAGITFLPYLGSGEQGALWDANLRGAIFGLTLDHRREDLSRALIEAIVIESRRCIRVLREVSPDSNELRAAGMATESSLFRQLLADATGCSVANAPAGATMASALGAALVAARSAGADPSLMRRDGQDARQQPDPTTAVQWTEIGRRYDRQLAMISTPRH